MQLEVWLMFAAVGLAAALSPGPAILLAITNAVSGGMRAVAYSSLGNIIGLMLVASVSMFGLGALLTASAGAFMVAKLAGALYLVYLGVKQLRRRDAVFATGPDVPARRCRAGRALLREGLLIALTNPKVIAFFSAVFPVFLDTARPALQQFVTMTATMMALSLLCLLGYGALARRARRWLVAPRRQRLFHRLAGGVFIAMGASLPLMGRGSS